VTDYRGLHHCTFKTPILKSAFGVRRVVDGPYDGPYDGPKPADDEYESVERSPPKDVSSDPSGKSHRRTHD
jgi:hypothetical protein